VAGASPLIEVTQSVARTTIRTREVVNLPILTRNLNGLLNLVPGSKPIVAIHPAKRNYGSVSFSGSTGRNSIQVVDGGDNRDNVVGGPLLVYTVEGIEEFQVAQHQFSAADGRSSGAAVNILTKSGTNALKGSGFLFERDKAMTAKDYFTAKDNKSELPFSRQQFGGSVGGPIVPNRAFFFGAVERIREETAVTIPDNVYHELELLAFANVKLPEGQKIDRPYRDLLYTVKGNVQLSQNHSLIGRVYRQTGDNRGGSNGPYTVSYGGGFYRNLDMRETSSEDLAGWDAVGQHSWTLGNRALNQFTVHHSRFYGLFDYSNYLADYPNRQKPLYIENLYFPTLNTGVASTGGEFVQNMWQINDAFTLQVGSHALKMGGDYSWMPRFGGLCCVYFPQHRFFDDPSTIVNNSNGKYPQGFQTPGAVQQIRAGADIKINTYQLPGTSQVKAYFQDDWRVQRKLTLNLGLRYDVDRNFYGQDNIASSSLTVPVLRAIGSPYAGFPHTPRKDISPRVGFAYDLSGDGRRVLRGGYGLYFDGTGINAHYNVFIQSNRPLSFDRILANTAVGVGDLATYRFGIDPPPPPPPAVTEVPGEFPPGRSLAAYVIDPNIKDPRTHQFHLGYSHELAPNTVLSADYTRATGLNDFKEVQINTFKNGVRRLAPDLARVYGDPKLLSSVQLQSSIGRSRYDELAVQFQRRLPRATFTVNYILSGAYAYGGQIAQSAYFVPASQDADCIFCPGEWGPTPADERHRVVVFSVVDLPFGLQVSPVFQLATARPYNLIAGTDLNGDGQVDPIFGLLSDRYVDPLTGQQVSVNSQRGDPFVLLDARVTKYFTVGQENRKLGVFVEFFNLFNTANFGGNYNGVGTSVLFKTPASLMPGTGYPFQVQLGARFDF
jgi:TonB-dependent receptor-like protein